MKTLQIMLLSVFSLFYSAEMNAWPIAQSSYLLSQEETATLIYEKNGISVYATSYLLEGETYVSLEFVNKTSQDLRFLWSVELDGTTSPVNMDGTIQAYMTVPSRESIHFGKSNSADPLLQTGSSDLEKDITISIKIQ